MLLIATLLPLLVLVLVLVRVLIHLLADCCEPSAISIKQIKILQIQVVTLCAQMLAAASTLAVPLWAQPFTPIFSDVTTRLALV